MLFNVIDSFLLQYKLSVFPPEVNRRIRSIGICPSRKWANPWWWHFYGNCCSQRNTIVYLVFFPFSFFELIYYDHGSTFMGEKCLCTLNDLESAKHGSTFFKSVIMYENWPFKKNRRKKSSELLFRTSQNLVTFQKSIHLN